jgi:hypothetical protein
MAKRYKYEFAKPQNLPEQAAKAVLQEVARVANGVLEDERVVYSRRISKVNVAYLRGYRAALFNYSHRFE